MTETKIPEGWQKVALGEFMKFKNGINADKSAYGQGTKFVNIMDVFRKSFLKKDDITGLVRITDKQLSEYSVSYGDILFNRTSETREEIAYSTVYTDKETATFGGFVIRGRQKKKLLLPAFAGYCFKNETTRKEMIRRSQGAVRANIGQKDLNKVSILIPPKYEQEKIAQILSDCDTTIEKTEALIAMKEKRFKWLLETLISDQQDNSKWKEVRLNQISTCYSGGTPSTQVPQYYDGNISFITSSDLNQRYINSVKGRLSNSGVENSSAKYVKKNTLLIALYGATAGTVAITHIEAAINQAVLAIVVNKNHCNNFIFFALEQYKNTLVKKYRQGGQPNLNAKIIKSIKLRLPPLYEQKQIAHVLNTAQHEIELLKKITEQYRSQKRGLMHKLLTGKLKVNT